MITKRNAIPGVTSAPASLSATLSELVREGGGRRTIVADGRTFVLSVTPAAPGQSAPSSDDTDRVAALEAELLTVGDQGQRSVLAHPDMLDLDAASSLSGIPMRTLTHMRRTNRILALGRAGARKGFRFPAFQFEAMVLSAMPAVLAAFGPTRAWQAFDFLTHSEPLLSGAVPVELLRSGRPAEVERVIEVAAALVHGAY